MPKGDFPVHRRTGGRVFRRGIGQSDSHVGIRKKGRIHRHHFLRDFYTVGVYEETSYASLDFPPGNHGFGIDCGTGQFDAFHVNFPVEQVCETQIHAQTFHIQQTVVLPVYYLHVLQVDIEKEGQPQSAYMHFHTGGLRQIGRGLAYGKILYGGKIKQCSRYEE